MKTFIKKVDFPVYGLDFTFDDRIVAVGGGGTGKSGVKNKLVIESPHLLLLSLFLLLHKIFIYLIRLHFLLMMKKK